MRTGLLALLVCTVSAAASAQSNTIAGLDAEMNRIGNLTTKGRKGTFPHGTSGVSFDTNICNTGSVAIEWKVAMDPRHPIIAFMLARELNGRLEQISDRSDVKHTFFATNASDCSFCTDASDPTVLAIGCSDTYGNDENGDRYWLAPAAEIDPWLVAWDPVCSHFDQGEPAVAPPANCDGLRSLSTSMASALNPVGHRVNITDQEFQVPGTWYYQGYYVINGEPEDVRENNWGTRTFTPSWSGTKWNLTSPTGFVNGSILTRWSGAVVTSAKNGNDDGRLYVGVKVTGPVAGLYHYEYALQNRDNFRGAGDVSIPICSGARILNLGFSDVDDNAANDWIAAVNSTSIDFDANGNPVRWNSFYNFWFDSDAAPMAGSINVDEHDAGAGLASLDITTGVPTGLFNVYLGDGCSLGGGFPSLYANGQATLGNPSFAIGSSGNQPGQVHILVAGAIDGSVALPAGCTQWFAGTFGAGAFVFQTGITDGSGVVTYAAPIPADPSYEGMAANLQAASLNPGGGPIAGLFDLTNGLKVRIGNSIPGCP